MISFINDSNCIPFINFRKNYQKAMKANQNAIHAMAVSSFNPITNEVNSRFVNLKYIDKNKLFFFTNYNSPKSYEFKKHNQVSALIYWSSIHVQIRMKGYISRADKKLNQKYFSKRSSSKNALAISSNQSERISSYEQVISNYQRVKNNNNLKNCPNYWGGFFIEPFEIEFWYGHENRINRRDVYTKVDTKWSHYILEP